MYNANNYGYNPYGRYIPQQPIQQTIQNSAMINTDLQRPILNGKQVDSLEVVKAMDIPLDGSVSYFPLFDGSAIITKQLQNDGTSKTIVFKPIEEQKLENKYITQDEMKKAIDGLDLSVIDDIKEELNDLKKEIRDLKKKKVVKDE